MMILFIFVMLELINYKVSGLIDKFIIFKFVLIIENVFCFLNNIYRIIWVNM